ncbi:MAG TPA: hypothetical protein VGM59_09880, partial [Dongiaceae bacterium]
RTVTPSVDSSEKINKIVGGSRSPNGAQRSGRNADDTSRRAASTAAFFVWSLREAPGLDS